MSTLIEKMQNYANNEFINHKDHYQTLKDGQTPHTLLVTCSDSRLSPQEFSQTQGGELFVIRNAGNLIPAYDAENPSNEGLTIEYGVCALGIKEIVICGHASCGAMGGLKDIDAVQSLPLVHKGLKNYRENHTSEVEGKNLEQLISWNVDNQLLTLFAYPFIKERVQSGDLKVMGIVYDFVNGGITHQSTLTPQGEVNS